YPDGRAFPEISFAFNTSDEWRRLGEYLQQRWKEALGLNLRLVPMEFSSFQKWRRSEAWAQLGDLYRGGWFGDYEDPQDLYNLLWDSQSDPLAFSSGWKNDPYDALVRQAAGERDTARRAALSGQAEDILAREYPQIPLFHFCLQWLIKAYGQGVKPERVIDIPSHQPVWL